MQQSPHHSESKGSRTLAVMQAVRARIASRALLAGDRLPSIRNFASLMKVSPSTVVEAYDRLVAEGVIQAKSGSGFYVSASALPSLLLIEDLPQHARAVDPFWVSRQSLDAGQAVVKPGCGWLASDWMPDAALRRAVRQLARSRPEVLFEYGSTRGALELRRLLLGRLADEGMQLAADQLLLTASGTQAIDLICRFMLRPGDTVLVDDPCYFNFRALLRVHAVKIVSVPYTVQGPDMAAFEAVVQAEKPKLYITNSALHNPTGATLSAQTAHRLLNIAITHHMTIVEDDIFADFEPELSLRLAALDGLAHVIRIGSFSKTLSASLRCGYIAGRAEWIAELSDLQLASNFGGPSPMAAEVIATILASGSYRKHIAGLQRRLVSARRKVAGQLQSLGITPWLMPRGGFYLWCQLPAGADSVNMARLAALDNLVLAPGNVFSASQSCASFMRFNVTHCGGDEVMALLDKCLNRAITHA